MHHQLWSKKKLYNYICITFKKYKKYFASINHPATTILRHLAYVFGWKLRIMYVEWVVRQNPSDAHYIPAHSVTILICITIHKSCFLQWVQWRLIIAYVHYCQNTYWQKACQLYLYNWVTTVIVFIQFFHERVHFHFSYWNNNGYPY